MICFPCCVVGLVLVLVVFRARDSGNIIIISFNFKINHKK